MNRFRQLLLGALAATAVAGFLGWSASAGAAGKGANGMTQSKDLVLRGDAVCTRCHDEEDDYPVVAISKTPHGVRADLRTPTCTSCHGASSEHVHPTHSGPRPKPDRMFEKTSTTPVDVQNKACLSCHQNNPMTSHWAGSTHQLENVACSSCHKVHAAHDPVLSRSTQPQVCFTCHKEQRAQIDRPSHHPIPEGKMACSDCHNPMGSVGPHLLKRDSVNDTCYTCHMEKRGPFVHNHEPVTDDCTNCHNPHGTVTEFLLKMRPPMLCHQCHSPHGAQVLRLVNQQSLPGAPSISSGKNGINYAMARGCLNCHTEVHGSNNPAGGGIPLGDPNAQFLFR